MTDAAPTPSSWIAPRWRKRMWWFFGTACGLGAAAVLAFLLAVYATDFDPARLAEQGSVRILDRNGRAVRILPDVRGERSWWAERASIPLMLEQAFLAAEDQRFYVHPGFDPIAIARAALANLERGRVVSGASTLTQQLVRQVYPRPRTVRGKASELLRAAKSEAVLSKDEILTHYVNRAPMGNGVVGVRMAAQLYFHKSLDNLSPAECATLAALPKAPSRMNPYHIGSDRLFHRRNWVLGRMASLGFIPESDADRMQETPLLVKPKSFPFAAPHLVDRVLAQPGADGDEEVRLTIDSALQKQVESGLKAHRARLAEMGAGQAAALVVDNRSMDVLAYVGSLEYAAEGAGFNDGVVARRSAGSALKPFLYGLGFNSGFTPADILDDTPRRYRSPGGEYLPRNYDRREYGPTTIRSALGNSLNLAAVRMMAMVGAEPFHEFLVRTGLLSRMGPNAEHFGLGLAIGNAEVRLEDLVAAYAMLANGGVHRSIRLTQHDSKGVGQQILSQEAAFLITDILSDPGARTLTFGNPTALNFPFRVAWKTGTSTKYRDSWIVGYTPEYTVGVWAGNFDGKPMIEGTGADAAGPVFGDIVRLLYPDRRPGSFAVPDSLESVEVCSHSGGAPTPYCPSRRLEWFIREDPRARECQYHQRPGIHHDLPAAYTAWVHDRRDRGVASPFTIREEPARARGEEVEIVYPLDGDEFIASGDSADVIRCEAGVNAPTPYVTWYVDGEQVAQTEPPYRFDWTPEQGWRRLMAVTADGSGHEIRVHIQ